MDNIQKIVIIAAIIGFVALHLPRKTAVSDTGNKDNSPWYLTYNMPTVRVNIGAALPNRVAGQENITQKSCDVCSLLPFNQQY